MRHAEADLLVTEAVNNAIQHAPRAEELTLKVSEDHRGLLVSVSHLHPDPMEDITEGFGQLLLRRLSEQWGHEHDGEILTVWFVVRTPGTSEIPDGMSDAELIELMEAQTSPYAGELVRRHDDLSTSISRHYRGKGIEEEDLLQVARMALLKAILRFDPSVGELRPYAAATISGEMKKLLRDKGWSVRVPRSLQERSQEVVRAASSMEQSLGRPPEADELAGRLDISEEEVDESLAARKAYVSRSMDQHLDDDGVTLIDRMRDQDFRLATAADRLAVESAAAHLPERQRRILHLRFNEDMTQTEIASEVGVSQMHVSRLISDALDRLRTLMEG